MTDSVEKCTFTTRAGPSTMLRAGAPDHNQNARTHGSCSRTYRGEELAGLVALGTDVSLKDQVGARRISLRRVLDVISADGDLTFEEFCRLSALALEAAGTTARLPRDLRAISVDAAICATAAGNRDRIPGWPAQPLRAGIRADGTHRNKTAAACLPYPAVSGCLHFRHP